MEINFNLIWAAATLGLAGGVHCVAMCGSPSALVTPVRGVLPYQAGRITGYALLGVVAALGAASFSEVATHAAWVRPLWMMTHIAMLLMGAWMLISGQHPAWLQQALLSVSRVFAARVANPALAKAQPVAGGATAVMGGGGGGPAYEVRLPATISPRESAQKVALRSFMTGMAWALLPCGLLYSAALLAWMSGNVATGALAMAAFGVTSGAQLWLGQRGLLSLLRAGRESTAVRVAGAITLAGAGLLLWWAITGDAPAGFCFPGQA